VVVIMRDVRFQVLVAESMKMTVFWDVEPCSLTETGRHFRGAFCLRNQGDEFIALMVEVVSTSETSASFCETAWRKIREDSHLHDERRLMYQLIYIS
jgi:cAMP phosphodiesterase